MSRLTLGTTMLGRGLADDLNAAALSLALDAQEKEIELTHHDLHRWPGLIRFVAPVRAAVWGLPLLAMMLMLAGCQGQQSAEQSSVPQTLENAQTWRVLSWDVSRSSLSPADAVERLMLMEADLICLQNLDANWIEFLAQDDLLQQREVIVAPTSTAQDRTVAVISRSRILDVSVVRAPLSLVPAQLITVQAQEREPWQLVNLALRSPIKVDPEDTWAAPVGTRVSHQREVKQVYAYVDHRMPLVIAGQFYHQKDAEAAQWLVNHQMRDVTRSHEHLPTRILLRSLAAMNLSVVDEPTWGFPVTAVTVVMVPPKPKQD